MQKCDCQALKPPTPIIRSCVRRWSSRNSRWTKPSAHDRRGRMMQNTNKTSSSGQVRAWIGFECYETGCIGNATAKRLQMTPGAEGGGGGDQGATRPKSGGARTRFPRFLAWKSLDIQPEQQYTCITTQQLKFMGQRQKQPKTATDSTSPKPVIAWAMVRLRIADRHGTLLSGRPGDFFEALGSPNG